MSNEEQVQEIEVLQSIYPDEFTQTSDTSFRIRLALDPPPVHGNDAPAPILILHVTYPPSYPDVAPELDLSLDPTSTASASPSPGTTLSFPDDKETLLTSLASTIEENLGMAMVFSLTSTLKESAEELLTARANAAEAEREAVIRKEEEKEMEKFRGMLVTRERFLEWREKFLAEQAEERRRREEEREEEKGKRERKTEKRLTGKELFERGLAGEYEEDENELEVAKLKIEA